MSLKTVEMDLEYMDVIQGPPYPQKALYKQACSADDVTHDSWAKQWEAQVLQNLETFDVAKQSVMSEHGKFAYKPGIIAGAGPSLKENINVLVEGMAKAEGNISLCSCLHNFGFFEDKGVKPDYYLNLDAGDITIKEMSQSGEHDADYYWERTKDHTLVTALVGHPELLKKWQGKILFFNTMTPHDGIFKAVEEKAKGFKIPFQTGGNTLGACLYMSRAVLGCTPISFIGADFAFDYTKRFHPYDNDYNCAGTVDVVDVFGNRRKTWQSYLNFALWFSYIACGGTGNNPGIFINCTEGGILGAYREGNIKQITQMPLSAFFHIYTMHKRLPELIDKNMMLF